VARTSLTERRWFPSHQPQTLQFAVALLYWNALLGLLFALVAGGIGRIGLVLVAADVAGGFGIANERRWGYYLAVVAAIVPLAMLIASGLAAGGILTLLFEIALVALLLHPQSRSYFKTWFR
jgi:hypothetical protein